MSKRKIRPQARNANKHTPRGMKLLEQEMGNVGYTAPMVAAADGELFIGSARAEVAELVFKGIEPIIVESDGTRPIIHVRTDIPTASDPRAVRAGVADNHIQRVDYEPDGDVLAGIMAEDEATLRGLFAADELRDLLPQAEPPEDAGAQIDRAEELREKWGVLLGDLWAVGDHRVVCGDCTDAAVVARVMGGERARLVVTDPPYNVDIVGGTHDPRDKKNHNKGPRIQNDSMPDDDFDIFLNRIFNVMESNMENGAGFYICSASGPPETQFRAALLGGNLILSQCIVWVKQRFVFSRRDYHYRHESILYGWKKGAHFFCDDRTQDTVWEIDRPMRSEKEHPTQKPPALFERMVQNSSRENDLILDPFLGSGTTLVACERLHRRGRGIELSPAYVAVTLERMSALGLTPQLLERAA